MAKSIRSKRMRKLRAFKRIRYGEKELARLKNMLQKAAEEEKLNAVPSTSTNPEPVSVETESVVIETNVSSENSKVTKPPKYPCWLSNFKIKKLVKIEKKCKKKEIKRLKKEKKAELKKRKGKKNKRK